MKITTENFAVLPLQNSIVSEWNILPPHMLTLTCQSFEGVGTGGSSVQIYELRFMNIQDFKLAIPNIRCRIAEHKFLRRSDFLKSFKKRDLPQGRGSSKNMYYHFQIKFDSGSIDVIAKGFLHIPIFNSLT